MEEALVGMKNDSPTATSARSFLHRPHLKIRFDRFGKTFGQGIKSERRLGVLRPSNHVERTARCLAESSFLTGPGRASGETEEQRLQSESYRDALAEGFAEAIEAYL